MRLTNTFQALLVSAGYLENFANTQLSCEAFAARSRFALGTTTARPPTARLFVRAFQDEHPPKDVLDKFDNHSENLSIQPRNGEEEPHSTPDQILAKFDDHFVASNATTSGASSGEVQEETKSLSKKLLPWTPVVAATLAVGATARTYNAGRKQLPKGVLTATMSFATFVWTKLQAVKTLIGDVFNSVCKWTSSAFSVVVSKQIRTRAASMGCSPAVLTSGLIIGVVAITWGLVRTFKPAPNKQPVKAGAVLPGFETDTPFSLLAKFDNHDCDSVAPKPLEEPHHPTKDVLDKFDNHST